MLDINSFYGECSFNTNNAPKVASQNATKQAQKWIEELEDEWDSVEVTAVTAQYFPSGDYALYFITVTVKVEGVKE